MVLKNIQVQEIKQYIITVDGEQHIFKKIDDIEEYFKCSRGTAFNIIKGKKKTIDIKNKIDGKLKLRNQ